MRCKLFSIVFFISPLSAISSPNTQWLQHSWVSVYERPDQNSKLIGHWVINTKLEMLGEKETETAKKDAWCHVKTKNNEIGYLECSAILPQKVSEAKDPMMRFWMTPTLSNWIEAGFFLESQLSENIRNLELEDLKSRRYPVPEFDAMKLHMSNWVAVEFKTIPVIMSNEQIFKNEMTPANDFDISGQSKLLQPHTAKTSLFKKETDIQFSTNTNIENIAVVNDAKLKAQVTKAGYVKAYRNSNSFIGFWDVAEVAVELSKTVSYHSVAANGLLGVMQGKKFQLTFEENESCGSAPTGLIPADAKALKDYPAISEPLIEFYLALPLLLKKVSVVKRSKTIVYPSLQNNESEKTVTVQYEIDLNQDGIPDLVIQQGQLVKEDGLYPWNTTYVNINGVWYIGTHFEEPECT